MQKKIIHSQGAGTVCFYQNQILLVQMNYGPFKGHWILPGGSVEDDEHPHQTAVREYREETNLDIELTSLMGIRHRIKKDGEINTYWIFKGEILNPQQKIEWPESELIEVRFWNIEMALKAEQIRPHTRFYLQHALNPQCTAQVTRLDGGQDDVFYKAL